MRRHYFRVAPFALGRVLSILDNDKENVGCIAISLEDGEPLISFDEETPKKKGLEIGYPLHPEDTDIPTPSEQIVFPEKGE